MLFSAHLNLRRGKRVFRALKFAGMPQNVMETMDKATEQGEEEVLDLYFGGCFTI